MNKLALRYTLNQLAKLVGKENLPKIISFWNGLINKEMSREEYKDIIGEPTLSPDADITKGFFIFDKTNADFQFIEKPDTKAVFHIGHFDRVKSGTIGEFTYKFEMLNGKIVRRLYMYDDGAASFADMPELIQYLAELGTKEISVEDFKEGLINLGLTFNK